MDITEFEKTFFNEVSKQTKKNVESSKELSQAIKKKDQLWNDFEVQCKKTNIIEKKFQKEKLKDFQLRRLRYLYREKNLQLEENVKKEKMIHLNDCVRRLNVILKQ